MMILLRAILACGGAKKNAGKMPALRMHSGLLFGWLVEGQLEAES
jgi:hypothetical protein